jgi:PAS domain S-box-containing protein
MNECPEELFPLIFDSVNEGVFTVDEEFRITSFNAAAEQITGIPRSKAVGRPCHEVLRTNICQSGCALGETLKTGEPHRDVRVEILNSEMEAVPLRVSTAVLKDGSGNLIGGVEIFRDVSDLEALRSELASRQRFGDIIGRSHAMREIFATIPQVAMSDVPVLVLGPSGTGKELVAQAVHDLSSRKERPFVRVNCGALPDTLLESELFGYAKGAFTGAVKDKPGRFSQADGGTLFLDEIGDVSPAFQVKLLRALEEGEITPLGDTRTLTVDVRLISATNRDLAQLVKEGTFREDLYYRIRVVPIELPALKDRREDIPLLIDHFIELLSTRTGRPAPQPGPEALRLLYDYDYPGNVRELKNILERAFVLCTSDRISPQCLPPELLGTPQRREPDAPEVRDLRDVLTAHGWNRGETAKALGIGRTTLWRRMKGLGLA